MSRRQVTLLQNSGHAIICLSAYRFQRWLHRCALLVCPIAAQTRNPLSTDPRAAKAGEFEVPHKLCFMPLALVLAAVAAVPILRGAQASRRL